VYRFGIEHNVGYGATNDTQCLQECDQKEKDSNFVQPNYDLKHFLGK
jgi:hypothetical protein